MGDFQRPYSAVGRGLRWAYVAFVALSLLWIPARTGFQLRPPSCEIVVTTASATASLSNFPHIILFALFFVLTFALMRSTPRASGVAAVVTMIVGLIVELEQGATGTGNCQLHDLIPNALGVLLGAFLMLLWWRTRVAMRRRT